MIPQNVWREIHQDNKGHKNFITVNDPTSAQAIKTHFLKKTVFKPSIEKVSFMKI